MVLMCVRARMDSTREVWIVDVYCLINASRGIFFLSFFYLLLNKFHVLLQQIYIIHTIERGMMRFDFMLLEVFSYLAPRAQV